MFTERTFYPSCSNLFSLAVEELRARGADLIDLTESNPTRCGITEGNAELLALFQNSRILRYEPDSRGMLVAREAVARHCFLDTDGKVSPERLFLFSGTSEAYAHLFRLICGAGEAVLLPAPSYPLFDELCRYCDVVPMYYTLTYDGSWFINMESVERGLLAGAKAIVLIHPGNPSGAFIKMTERAELNRLADQYAVPLIVDEVFHAYPLENTKNCSGSFVMNTNRLTFTLGGLSKLCGLPQLKLAWLAVSGTETKWVDEAIYRLDNVADLFLSVGTPIQCVLPDICVSVLPIRQEAIRRRTQENYRVLQKLLSADSPVTYLHTEGGWSVILRLPQVRSCEEWALLLAREAGVLVQPGYFFDIAEPSRVVVSLLVEPQRFAEGIVTSYSNF